MPPNRTTPEGTFPIKSLAGWALAGGINFCPPQLQDLCYKRGEPSLCIAGNKNTVPDKRLRGTKYEENCTTDRYFNQIIKITFPGENTAKPTKTMKSDVPLLVFVEITFVQCLSCFPPGDAVRVCKVFLISQCTVPSSLSSPRKVNRRYSQGQDNPKE